MTWLSDLTLETVVVHTVNGGPSYRGMKRAVYNDGLVLADAAIIEPEGVQVLQGDFFIPREQVHAMQLLGGAA